MDARRRCSSDDEPTAGNCDLTAILILFRVCGAKRGLITSALQAVFCVSDWRIGMLCVTDTVKRGLTCELSG